MAESMFFVGFCSSCGTGPLGIRICGACQRPVVLCDECDAIWLEPTVSGAPRFFEQPELPCPDCGGSLLSQTSHWATRAELAGSDWWPHVVGEGAPFESQRPTEQEYDPPAE